MQNRFHHLTFVLDRFVLICIGRSVNEIVTLRIIEISTTLDCLSAGSMKS
jgi:hypothetical protein